MSNNDTFANPQADRAPTPEEGAAADAGAQRVDLEDVSTHYQEMIERGANVSGEGQIEPD